MFRKTWATIKRRVSTIFGIVRGIVAFSKKVCKNAYEEVVENIPLYGTVAVGIGIAAAFGVVSIHAALIASIPAIAILLVVAVAKTIHDWYTENIRPIKEMIGGFQKFAKSFNLG